VGRRKTLDWRAQSVSNVDARAKTSGSIRRRSENDHQSAENREQERLRPARSTAPQKAPIAALSSNECRT
jgi:hypothetical protein